MNKYTANEVKEHVANYLKRKGYTQSEIGEKLALGRQSVSNILSNRKDYFNEKHAALFSLGYGFRKEFLMTGEGLPFEESSVFTDVVGVNSESNNAIEIIVNLLKKTVELSSDYNKLLLDNKLTGLPDRNILNKFSVIYSLFTPIFNSPQKGTFSNISDLNYARSVENIFTPLIQDLQETLSGLNENDGEKE